MAQAVGNAETHEAPATGRKIVAALSSAPCRGSVAHAHPHGSRHGLFSSALRAGEDAVAAAFEQLATMIDLNLRATSLAAILFP